MQGKRELTVLNKKSKYPDTKAFNLVVKRLKEKGVTVDMIAEIAYDLQKDYVPDLDIHEVFNDTVDVLHKRELLNNAMVALELDRLASEHLLAEPLQTIVMEDQGVFGVDEGLALAIAQLYGTIGVSSFGYTDKEKVGVIQGLDKQSGKNGVSNTFIDDVVGAIAAAVSGKIAHRYA